MKLDPVMLFDDFFTISGEDYYVTFYFEDNNIIKMKYIAIENPTIFSVHIPKKSLNDVFGRISLGIIERGIVNEGIGWKLYYSEYDAKWLLQLKTGEFYFQFGISDLTLLKPIYDKYFE